MNKLERLLIPIFLVVLLGALALERVDADTVRRLALWIAGALLVFLLGGFVARYVRQRRITEELREAERRAHDEPPPA